MSGVELTGAILSGGASRRMGRAKALLTLEPGGPALIELVAARLGEITDHLIVVGGVPLSVLPDVPRIPDAVAGQGPLGGIHAALAAANGSRVIVVACDMPFLNVNLLRYMVSLPEDADVIVPVTDRPQPLHAIYSPACLPHIEECLRDGNNRVTGWFDRVRVREIDRVTVAHYDPDLLSCFNMNTPEDLANAMQVHAERTCRIQRRGGPGEHSRLR